MKPRQFAVSAVILIVVAALGGCATSGKTAMDARAEVLAPATTSYPAVEDVPDRRGPPLTDAQQLKLKKDLLAARDHQTTAKTKPN